MCTICEQRVIAINALATSIPSMSLWPSCERHVLHVRISGFTTSTSTILYTTYDALQHVVNLILPATR